MKAIVLCADDYAQTAAISQGILELVKQRRLSAVSCFSEAEFWRSSDNALFEHREAIDIGLHFNLTHPFADSAVAAQPLGLVMRNALSGRTERAQIAKALHVQLDRFEHAASQIPDFVDGHQHVHVLPGIRNIVMRELTQRYGSNKPYLRAVNPRLSVTGDIVKVMVLKLLGAGFRTSAHRYGFSTNRRFGGIYSLQPNADFSALMTQWLAAAEHDDLFMCHPGAAVEDHCDPIGNTRPLEFAFLHSDAFAAQLSRHSIRLSRFRNIAR